MSIEFTTKTEIATKKRLMVAQVDKVPGGETVRTPVTATLDDLRHAVEFLDAESWASVVGPADSALSRYIARLQSELDECRKENEQLRKSKPELPEWLAKCSPEMRVELRALGETLNILSPGKATGLVGEVLSELSCFLKDSDIMPVELIVAAQRCLSAHYAATHGEKKA